MKKDYDNLKFITIWGLIIVFIVLLEIFTLDHVEALELRTYDQSYSVSGTNYYGWYVPTRNANYTNVQNKVWFSLYTEGQFNSPCTDQNCGSILLSSKENNVGINLPFQRDVYWVGTSVQELNLNNLGSQKSLYKNGRFAIQFQPGSVGDDPLSFLDDGITMNYSSSYKFTYKFDIILAVNNGTPVLPVAFHESGTANALGTGIFTTDVNSDLTWTYSEDDTTWTVLKRTYVMNIPTFLPGMSFGNTTPSLNINNNNHVLGYQDTQGILTNGYGTTYRNGQVISGNAFGSTETTNATLKFSVSQPYDIYYWKTDNQSLYCQTNCWTQDDSNNSIEYEYDPNENKEKDLLERLFNSPVFQDFGLTSIFINIFNKAKAIINNFSNDTCYSYKVTFFGKDIFLPCGQQFWSRSDITTFVGSIWSVGWTFIIGLYICRNMYLKIVSIFDFETGVVVDAKEVSRL